MALSTTHIDIPQMTSISQRFEQAASILQNVSRTLDVAMRVLDATAFIGLVGGQVVRQYIAMVQPRIDKLAEKCAELSADISEAIATFSQAAEAGDTMS